MIYIDIYVISCPYQKVLKLWLLNVGYFDQTASTDKLIDNLRMYSLGKKAIHKDSVTEGLCSLSMTESFASHNENLQ